MNRTLARELVPVLVAASQGARLNPGWPRIVLFVFAGYYLGARLGLALTFAPLPISVLWPPNAVLFAAMLVLPAGCWWLVAAAALPAHLLSELQVGIPPAMVVCWYVSNVSEALIGACVVRAAMGEGNPFTSVRGVLLFLAACTAAAVISSFLDSAFVVLNGWGQSGYWTLWSNRVVSNITADLVVVPAIAAWLLARGTPFPRGDEAALVFGGLALAMLVVVNSSLATAFPAAQVCVPVPFLLWAAFRFGPRGSGTAFAIAALAIIWSAGHGIGALALRSPLENAHSVQLYLLCIGPTLLFLAASADQMRRGVESLRVSEKRFQLVLEATSEVVYERDLASGALWWSRDGLAHFGYARTDALRDFTSLADLVHSEDLPRATAARDAALAGERTLWDAEYRVRRANGTYAHVHEKGFIVRDSAGRATSMIGALTDTTERHDTEELAQRLAQASRLTAMGELAASIAHEINQPISAILNNVDAAQALMDAGRATDADMREILDAIREDDLRASEIVGHIRGLANKRNTQVETLDMNALARGVIRLALPAARRRGVMIQSSCVALPPVRGDRIHLQQVLLNLLFNAMDAMREVPVEERVLSVTARACGADGVEVAVRDRGHGIPDGQMARIFDSFFTTKPDGMGLGLSIAHSLVTANGGRIWAQNNAGNGATFHFTIPADT
jgi:two-component system, LuxR family, sensor kinase FixL